MCKNSYNSNSARQSDVGSGCQDLYWEFPRTWKHCESSSEAEFQAVWGWLFLPSLQPVSGRHGFVKTLSAPPYFLLVLPDLLPQISWDFQSLPSRVLTHCLSEGWVRRGGPGTKDSTSTQYRVSGSSQLKTSVSFVTHWDHIKSLAISMRFLFCNSFKITFPFSLAGRGQELNKLWEQFVLLDLVLYMDTLYFRLEYICCMEIELSSGFFFHFFGAVRTIKMDFSSVVKATSGGPICVSKKG